MCDCIKVNKRLEFFFDYLSLLIEFKNPYKSYEPYDSYYSRGFGSNFRGFSGPGDGCTCEDAVGVRSPENRILNPPNVQKNS